MVQIETNGSCFQAGIEAILLRLLLGFLGFWFQFGGAGFFSLQDNSMKNTIRV